MNQNSTSEKRLARWKQGEAIISNDAEGVPRYVYEDGSLDTISLIDYRNPVVRANLDGKVMLVSLPASVKSVDSQRLELVEQHLSAIENHAEINTAQLRHLGFIARVA